MRQRPKPFVFWSGRKALAMSKRLLKGRRDPNALVFHSKRGSPLRETTVLNEILHPVLSVLRLPQAGMHAFRHGCNRRWELSGMNPAVLRQQMGDSSATMTARYTGEIPLYQIRAAFFQGEIGKYGKLWEMAALYAQSLSRV
jgi:integrase